jgi:putative addiction module component (TIGR02574 family)
MSNEVAKVLAQTEGWPVADRMELVHELWERLVNAGNVPLMSDEQRAEIDRRLDDLDANPQNLLTWDEVMARLRLPK